MANAEQLNLIKQGGKNGTSGEIKILVSNPIYRRQTSGKQISKRLT